MSDLNLLHGTVTGYVVKGVTVVRTYSNPERANDGDDATATSYSSYATLSHDPRWSILESDLGSAYGVASSVVRLTANNPGMTSLEHSSDGSTWTDSGAASSMSGWVQTFSLPSPITARYWRIVYYKADGYGYNAGPSVLTWTLDSAPPHPAGVHADWDIDGFGTADDDVLTSDVASWRITRGASAEITGGAQPGQCTIILNNPDDDRYNPMNASGPLYGLLRDGVPLWITVDADGLVGGDTAYGLFGGRIADITPVPQGGLGRAAQVEITGEDVLARLGRTNVTLEDALDRTQGDIREAILTAAGETSYALASETAVVPISAWDGSALAALEDINKANGTRHSVAPGLLPSEWYTYTSRNRYWRLDGSVDAALDAGTDHVTGTSGWRLSADTVINRQKVSVTPIRFTTRQTTIWSSPDVPFNVKSGSPRTVWVEFDDYVAAASVDKATDGSSLTATFTNYGTTGKIVLTSSGTTTVRRLDVEGMMVRRGNDLSAVADDTTSQGDARGVRSGSDLASQFTGSLAAAQGLADHMVWRYGNPQYRPTLTVVNWFPYQFDIDLYDVIEVTIAELAMTAHRFEVIGLTHECSLAASADAVMHTTTYVLQEARVQTSSPGWFVLDLSELDGTDVLGY